MTADYSGRHMYGVTCLAINVATEDRFAMIAALALAYAGTSGPGVGWIGDARIDNLGLGWVLYWPDVRLRDGQPRQWPHGEEDEDD